MNMEKKNYKKYTKARAPKSHLARDMVRAFIIGGLICTLGQGLIELYENIFELGEKTSVPLASVTLAAIAIFLTAIGIFDKIARVAGAGTLVPITGFANAVASPSIDSKAEGWILGVGAKMFSVAGPVIVYGIVSGIIYGIIYYIIKLF